jgi:hypothetical protein
MGLDANGNPITPGGGSTESLTADFKSIQDNVLTPICTKCHIGASAPEGLQLDQTHSYAMLVGVPSAEQPGVMRVDPGNPDSSYLVLKLQGSSGINGARMPLGGPYLPQSTIDVIRQWISSGAANSTNATGTATAKAVPHFSVTASSPDRDSIAVTVPSIVVSFSADIDPNLINGTTVSLERLAPMAGADMSADDPMDATEPMGPMASMPMTAMPAAPASTAVAVTLAVPRGDGSALLITPRAPLANGTYRITLRASLADMNARALGSDYTFKFTVEAP